MILNCIPVSTVHSTVNTKFAKQTFVIPIYKKGCSNVPTNYRPISVTCVMCRLFEAIISEKVLIHLLGNDLISPNQHDFVPGKSTHTQLILVLSKWYCSYDNNLDIDVVCTDLAIAFDTVSHPKLISI